MPLILAPQARDDIASILTWTERHFGARQRRNYAKLLATALSQLEANPEIFGSEPRAEIAANCRTYHLFFSRKIVARRIHRPRHFLLSLSRDGGRGG